MTTTKKEVKQLKGLTALDILKQNKALDGKGEFLIALGKDELKEDYLITHDMLFRKTKQQQVLEDMVRFFDEVNSFNVELLEMVTPYTSLLIIKHFTDLDVPNEIEDAMYLLEALIDLEALGAIINALPQDQVIMVFELLTQTIDNIKNNVEEAEAEALALSEKEEVMTEAEALKQVEEVEADGEKE
jgi:hypothetical protein